MSSLRSFASALRELPKIVALEVAARSADRLTQIAQATFAAGTDPYGTPWAPGEDGRDVTLRKSGALASGVRYVAIGEKLRLQLTTRYAKYQVGRRPVTPAQGQALPVAYSAALSDAARQVIAERLR